MLEIFVQSSPYQAHDICTLENGESCSFVGAGIDRYGLNPRYKVLRFPAKVYRLGDNPRHYQGVYYAVVKEQGVVQTGPDRYTVTVEWVKTFQNHLYQTGLTWRGLLAAAKEYANNCATLGESTAHAIYFDEPTPVGSEVDVAIGPNLQQKF